MGCTQAVKSIPYAFADPAKLVSWNASRTSRNEYDVRLT